MTEAQAALEQQSAADLGAAEHEWQDDNFQLAEEEAAAALEALLFAAGDPLPLEKIQQVTGMERALLQRLLEALASRMAGDSRRGLLLREIEGRYFLSTKPEMKPVLQRLFQPRQRPPLSQAAYETLAIIAYNQPVTRAQAEAVRGVNSDSIINRLVERNLVEEAGHLETPGRPILYQTTEQFLLDFGLRSVKDLPPMEMLMYGTLRDFETSLEEVSGRAQDRQLTIDQLVQAYVPADSLPGRPDPAAPAGTAEGPAEQDRENRQSAMPENTILAVSEALFGDGSAEDEQAENAGREPPDAADSGKSR